MSSTRASISIRFAAFSGVVSLLCRVTEFVGIGARSRRAGLLVVAVAGCACVLTVGPGVALAVPPTTIASYGSGAGQVDAPKGVALNSQGDLYVADVGNRRLDEFGPAGEFLLAWGYGVRDGFSDELQTCGPDALPPTATCFNDGSSPIPQSVAVEQSTGDVYVGEDGGFRVEKFTGSGEFLWMIGGGVNETAVKDNGSEAERNLCTEEEIEVDHDVCGGASRGTGQGEFSNGSGVQLPVAVGSAGNVWVGDTDRLEEFDSSGHFISEVPIIESPETLDLRIGPSGELYVISGAVSSSEPVVHGVRKFEASGAPAGVLDETGEPYALTVDATGDVFFFEGGFSEQRLLIFSASGKQIGQYGLSGIDADIEGLAVNEVDRSFYISESAERNSKVQRFSLPTPGPFLVEGSQVAGERTNEAVTLSAKLDPEGSATTYRFQYVTQEDFEHEGGFASPQTRETVESSSIGEDFGEHKVSARLEGLAPETRYRFRVIATNHCNPSVPAQECTVEGERDAQGNEIAASFEPLPLAVVEAEWMSEPSTSEATLDATVDPDGVISEYAFQYARSAEYEASGLLSSETSPERFIAPGLSGMFVFSRVDGLASGTAYDYRVVVRHGAFVFAGPVQEFSTQSAVSSVGLPDDRDWELVAESNNGGGIMGSEGGVPRAAEDGAALAYGRSSAVSAGAEANRAAVEPMVDIAQHGSSGWSSMDITVPYNKVAPAYPGASSEYRLFSGDLSASIVTPRDKDLLSPEASERTPYRRVETAGKPLYEPLLTRNDVAEGVKFGGEKELVEDHGLQEIEGASPDLEHVVFSSGAALTSGSVSGSMYEWSSGSLTPVSVLPESEGGKSVHGYLGGEYIPTSTRNAISSDGSLVYWSKKAEFSKNPSFAESALYVRDMRTEESLRLDVPQGVVPKTGEAQVPEFQIASVDGSRVFFTDMQKLTEGATATAGSPDLYECVITAPPTGAPSCALSDVTDKVMVAGESADVQGLVPAANEAGTRLYFVAKGALAAGATAGEDNLYTAVENGGVWRVAWIATLSEEDAHDWGEGGLRVPAQVFARSSPDGRYFTFMSDRGLTGYDTHDVVSGVPDEEVYLYDAQSGRLSCVSCDPTGARPRGFLDTYELGNSLPPYVDYHRGWSGRWLAGLLPQWEQVGLVGALAYQPRYLSDSGRLFFESDTPLVPEASNGSFGVYEYEPAGIGNCVVTSAGYVAALGGCVSLLSPATADGESAFMDASANGDDAFIMTPGASVGGTTPSYSVYDAHSCEAGSGWGCVPPSNVVGPPCSTTESCRAAPVPQPSIYGAPSSETFSGTGNIVPAVASPPVKKVVKKTVAKKCPKGERSSHGKCVRGKAKDKKSKGKKARVIRSGSTRRGGR